MAKRKKRRKLRLRITHVELPPDEYEIRLGKVLDVLLAELGVQANGQEADPSIDASS